MGIAELKVLQGSKQVNHMSLEEYLDGCKSSPAFYANAHERILTAIGEPELVDTPKASDPRLARIFMSRTIRRYKAFEGFYGMEESIEQLVSFFRHGAQGLEERKQVLYLLGPVGGGKSSLAERLKTLMEKQPIYVLAVNRTGKKTDVISGPLFTIGEQVFEASPLFESPLGLFNAERDGIVLSRDYGIPERRLVSIASPWAQKRLHNEFDDDVTKFSVLELWPSQLRQIAVAKVEPGDENNQDVSALIGKVDLRKLDRFSQSDADAYGYAGGLNRANQGLLEFVEMFKAPIKMLHPLLTATQEGNYAGTDNIGMLPFQGIILAHSNETEWLAFKSNKNNQAFLDRICLVKVPYCLRYTEEEKIYRKLIDRSELSTAPCAPWTLEMLAQFCVLSRLKTHENSELYPKMCVYNGDDIKDTHPKAKSAQEYRDAAGQDEGMEMEGLSTRLAYKVLSATFNRDTAEVAADPVQLMYVLELHVMRERFPEERTKQLLAFIKGELMPRYADKLQKELQAAYLESFDEYGQNKFDHYIAWADAWVDNADFKNPETGQMLKRNELDTELSKIEKPAGISNPKDFRNEVVHYVLRYRANHGGKNPEWKSYEKLRDVIEKQVFSTLEDLLPVLTFDTKKDSETERKHQNFVTKMKNDGYTERQIRLLVEWYVRLKKS